MFSIDCRRRCWQAARGRSHPVRLIYNCGTPVWAWACCPIPPLPPPPPQRRSATPQPTQDDYVPGTVPKLSQPVMEKAPPKNQAQNHHREPPRAASPRHTAPQLPTPSRASPPRASRASSKAASPKPSRASPPRRQSIPPCRHRQLIPPRETAL